MPRTGGPARAQQTAELDEVRHERDTEAKRAMAAEHNERQHQVRGPDPGGPANTAGRAAETRPASGRRSPPIQLALNEASKLVATVTAELERERGLRQHDSQVAASWQAERAALEAMQAQLEQEKQLLEQRLLAGKTAMERQKQVRVSSGATQARTAMRGADAHIGIGLTFLRAFRVNRHVSGRAARCSSRNTPPRRRC